MMMYFSLVLGLTMLLLGANFLVDSSVAIAKRAHVSSFVIGLTIVGMGTSAPEMFISFSSALSGHGAMSIGNVMGSNICNTLLILGATATVLPFTIDRPNIKRDIPISVICAILVACIGYFYGVFNWVSGLLLLTLFASYMIYVVRSSGADESGNSDDELPSRFEKSNIFMLILIAIASLAMLVYGGDMFLDAARNIALSWGISEAVISITIVALGTSLPELVTCVIAATRGNAQLALGNVLGSNAFNALFILGGTALISPIDAQSVPMVNYLMLVVSSVLVGVTAFTFGRMRFDRIEGVAFLIIYFSYMAYLLVG